MAYSKLEGFRVENPYRNLFINFIINDKYNPKILLIMAFSVHYGILSAGFGLFKTISALLKELTVALT